MPPSEGIWRNRNFVAALIGGTVNDVGDWMLEIAVPVYVYMQTGSGAATAAVYIIDLVVGVVLGPYGGSLADRWNLRSTLIGTNLLQIAALMPLFAVNERSDLAGVRRRRRPGDALRRSTIPPRSRCTHGSSDPISWFRPTPTRRQEFSIARLVGSPLGGIIVATGGLKAIALVDAATFLVGAGSAVLIENDARSLRSPTMTSPRRNETARFAPVSPPSALGRRSSHCSSSRRSRALPSLPFR